MKNKQREETLMKKRTMLLGSLLPAALLAAPDAALAQANVTVYGRIHAGLDHVSVSKTPTLAGGESATRVSDNSSKFGFRGVEDLGSGNAAFFQIEGSAKIDTGAGGINDKDTYVGLRSKSLGQVQLGRFSTPIKDMNGMTNRFLGEGIQDDANISQLGGDSTVYGFNRRQSNSLRYQTPSLGGFTGTLQRGQDVEGPGGNSVLSGSVIYQGGPLKAGAGYEEHRNLNPGFKDKIYRVSMNYNFGGGDVGVSYNRLTYNVARGSLERGYFTVTGAYKIGAGALIGRYGVAGDVSGSAPVGTSLTRTGTSLVRGPDSGAKQFTLGYEYNLSKRTQLYTYYTQTDNDKNANYTFGSNAFSTPAPGSKVSGYILGIVHVF
jgi:predicted porin